ncbi:MAG: excinuclease ABC subunit UvrC [Gemmatimonadales bacterium]|nr:excinuclease ABC subunit UvrC [Gemmatimonadales bacterium]
MSRDPKDHSTREKLQHKLSTVPDAPGVYLHKDKQGKVLYVGKASRLNQRVRSYFQPARDRDLKTDALVKRVHDIDYIVTDTPTDALVLENQLIKEYRPKYNIRLKDDKQYPYIKISLDEAFPRVTVVRDIVRDKARYFGPFTDVTAMRETLKFAAGVFGVRTCHLDLPDQNVSRPCLDYQIGRCSAPCVGYDSLESYGNSAQRMVRFLEGAEVEILKELREEMDAYSRDHQYENAAKVRDLIQQLERTTTRGRPVSGVSGDCDLCGVAREGQDAACVILRVRAGKIRTSDHFLLADKLDSGLEAFMGQLLREYYPRAGDIPGEILLSHPLSEIEPWAAWLGDLRGAKVKLKHPLRGARKEAVELAHTNAVFRLREACLDRAVRLGKKVTPADIQLQEALELHTVPETIECFDISNFQGKETVASLVYFRGRDPLKSRYRRFRIKTVPGIDDFASMEEVLDRYYSRLLERKLLPADLVVVDGGAGQLSVARRVLGKLGFHGVQLIGLAKREETIYKENRTIDLPRGCEAQRLLQRVRDEAHRFAITYHRLLRDKKTTDSELDLIPGIGRMKKLALLHHFGSVVRIRESTTEELADVRGINRHDVVAIQEFFSGRDKPSPRQGGTG